MVEISRVQEISPLSIHCIPNFPRLDVLISLLRGIRLELLFGILTLKSHYAIVSIILWSKARGTYHEDTPPFAFR